MPPPAEVLMDAESSEPEVEEDVEMEEDVVETEEDGVETEDDGGSNETEDGKGSEEGHSRAGVRISVAAAAAGDGDVGPERPPNCCCVCMEPWTCNGAHRICCIPCGHVYGRSCLERWLQRSGNMSAKCPQCGERFELKHVTNLYAPGNLLDVCCHAKECNTQIAQLKAEVVEAVNRLRAELVSGLKNMNRNAADYRDQLDRNVAAMLKEFASTKEQMKRMIEGGASPKELMEFMEQPVPKHHPAAGA